jgi:hypothetical protein
VKYFIDALRYENVIADDTAAHVTVEVSQRKARKGEEPHTLITLDPQ